MSLSRIGTGSYLPKLNWSSFEEVMEFLAGILVPLKTTKNVVAVTAIATALVAIHKLISRRRGQNSYPDLPNAHWLKGHVDLIKSSESRGRTIQKLGSLANWEPGYLRVYTGTKSLVLLKLKDMKELFQKNGLKSSGRDGRLKLHLEYRPKKGVLETSGAIWKENRKIFLSHMRTWGKENQLKLTIAESEHLVEAIDKTGHEFNPENLLQMAVSNIISTFIFGSRFDYFDPETHQIFESISKFNSRIRYYPYAIWTLLKYVPLSSSFTRRMNGIKRSKEFIKSKIEERLKTGVKSPPETLIDAYSLEFTNPLCQFDIQNLEMVIYELFFAGTETTSTTLMWFLACAAKHPKMQDKMFEEVSETFGDAEIQLDDFKKLDYTLAVQHEVQRFGSIAQVTIVHKMTDDVKMSSGKTVKKDETVLGLLYGVMRDPLYFKHPEEFNPDNFLDENGKFQSNEAFVPYGVGPRVCLGQMLADLELKVFMVELVKNFRISSGDDIELSSRVQKITSCPKSYNYIFTKR